MYRTRHMVAQVEMTYADEFLRPGERFLATPVDAGYLIKCRRACDAQDAPDQTPLAVYAPEEAAVEVVEAAPTEEAQEFVVRQPVVTDADDAAGVVARTDVEMATPARRRGRPRTVKADE
jgi:hypothetical protein